MEEKLNMIYRKLIDIENNMKKESFEIKLKVLENKQREINYEIDNLKHDMMREQEYNDELLKRFLETPVKNYKVEEAE